VCVGFTVDHASKVREPLFYRLCLGGDPTPLERIQECGLASTYSTVDHNQSSFWAPPQDGVG
jgi:hypothetical protein